MNYFLGIDLGSTTSKAVIMDEDKNVIGRGITNTRSNYKIATEVARSEAFISAGFYLLRQAIQDKGGFSEAANHFLNALEKDLRYEQQLSKLNYLEEMCLVEAEDKRFDAKHQSLQVALESIFRQIGEEAPQLFSSQSSERSQFFRDIVGSRFLAIAEKLAAKDGLNFEDLMGLYDKSIIKVENQLLDEGFEVVAVRALDRTLRGLKESDNAAIVESIKSALKEIVARPLEITNMVGTGYGRQLLPFKKEQIRSEILCHGLGAHFMFPGTRTVLDIGGQDTKGIQVDEKGIVTGFQMNDRCAAGCGRYLGYIADELNLGLHELGPLSLQATRNIRINSTCTVFAGAELRDRLAMGEGRENILAGLHRAIILRAMSLLARSGGIRNEFTFTGGVAKNQAMVKSLRELAREHYGAIQLNIHPDSIYTGALGAALFALQESGK